MPRVRVPVTKIPQLAGAAGGALLVGPANAASVMIAFDNTNDHEMVNNGATVLVAQNTANAAATFNIDSVPSPLNGRLGDITVVVPAYVSATQNALAFVGPFPPSLYSQGDGGNRVHIDSAAAPATLFLMGLDLSVRSL